MWLERHRVRIDGCAAQQTCAIRIALRVTRADGKLGVALQRASPDNRCVAHPILLRCLDDLVKEPVPPPDVCPDGECHAEVLIAFD